MTRYCALLRGINVGRAKRIAMAELKSVMHALGYTRVATLLNSGNVLFDAPESDCAGLQVRIEAALLKHFAITVPVIVVPHAILRQAVANNLLAARASDAARLLVAFVTAPKMRDLVIPLLDADWSPEALALGEEAIYLWCADGVIDSKLFKALTKALGASFTTRNWTTMQKIAAQS